MVERFTADREAVRGQARMLEEATGLLYGQVPHNYIGLWVPSAVEVSTRVGLTTREEQRCLDFSPWLPYKGNTPPDWGWHLGGPNRGMLNAFVRLVDGSEGQIRAFAARSGPLYFCHTHARCFWNPLAPDRGCTWTPHEPLWVWRKIAGWAQSTLQAAANLRLGNRVPSSLWKGIYDAADRELIRELKSEPLDKQHMELCYWLNEWGSMFTGTPVVWVLPDLRLSLGGGFGFLPAVWFALVEAVTHRDAVFICDGCGKAYSRQGRRPPRNRNSYCEKCGKRASKRDYMQRYRARQRSEMAARKIGSVFVVPKMED